MQIKDLKIEDFGNLGFIADDPVVPIREAIDAKKMNCDRYSTGFDIFDKAMLGGFKDGDLVIISGVSGHGKTSYAQTLTYNLCHKGIPCVWFSYEVSLEHLDRKFTKMGIEDFYHIYTPKKNTTGKLEWIKFKIKESWIKYATKVVFIDHIDFLTPSSVRTQDNETIALKKIATELKSMAIELGIVIVCMAHLKKLPDGKEPDMQDIGYCLPAGSKILNADNGCLVDIKEIYDNKKFINVVSFDKNFNQVKKPIIGVKNNGIKNVYKIITSSGNEIEATGEHKFFKDDNWVKLKNLSVGDYLAVPGILPHHKNNDYKINLVEIIGWMLGDGYFSKNGTGELILQDKNDLKHIIKLLKGTNVLYKYYNHKKWFVLKFKTRKNKNDKFINKNKSNDLKKIIIELGLMGIIGKNKLIPKKLLNQNNKVISVLLRGLFQSDGCVSNVDLKNRLTIDFSNISKTLINQIKLLLLRFSIRSRIKECKSGKYKSGGNIYRIIIEGKKSIINFEENIKLINKKGENIKKQISYIKKRGNTTKAIYDFLPPKYKKLFFKIKRENKITWKNLGFRICYHQNRIKKDWWNKLCILTNNKNKIISSYIDFDKIKTIKFMGKKQVYDVEVADTHNFVCNGLYTHNCAGIFQLADYVFIIMREKINNGKIFKKREFSEDLFTNNSFVKIVKNRETGKNKNIKLTYLNEKFIQITDEKFVGMEEPEPNRKGVFFGLD